MAQVTATDADDPMFGNNAKLIYSILQGEPYFSVEPKTGTGAFSLNCLVFISGGCADLSTTTVWAIREAHERFGCAEIIFNFITSGLRKDRGAEMFPISSC